MSRTQQPSINSSNQDPDSPEEPKDADPIEIIIPPKGGPKELSVEAPEPNKLA